MGYKDPKSTSMRFSNGIEQGVCSPTVAERISTLGAIHCFRTLPKSSSSSSEERDSDCFKEISPIDKGYHSSRETGIFSPKIVIAETPKFILRPAKRIQSHGGIKFNKFSPAPLFPKGTE